MLVNVLAVGPLDTVCFELVAMNARLVQVEVSPVSAGLPRRILTEIPEGVLFHGAVSQYVPEELVRTVVGSEVPLLELGRSVEGERVSAIYLPLIEMICEVFRNALRRGIERVALIHWKFNPEYREMLSEALEGVFDERGLRYNQKLVFPEIDEGSLVLSLTNFVEFARPELVFTVDAMSWVRMMSYRGWHVHETPTYCLVNESVFSYFERPPAAVSLDLDGVREWAREWMGGLLKGRPAQFARAIRYRNLGEMSVD